MVNKFFPIIKTLSLFRGLNDAELNDVLAWLDVTFKVFSKNKIILTETTDPKSMIVVLSGLFYAVNIGLDGIKTLIGIVHPGETLTESLCYADIKYNPATLFVAAGSVVMSFKCDRLLTYPGSLSVLQKMFLNIARQIANRSINLRKRSTILSIYSTRGRILAYLQNFIPANGNQITIPFNQTELANYICVNRSAMVKELSKMKREGLINYKGKTYTMHPNKKCMRMEAEKERPHLGQVFSKHSTKIPHS